MTKNQFRLLFIGWIVTGLLSGFIDVVLGLLPQDLQQVYLSLLMKESRLGDGFMLTFVVVFLVSSLASLYGTLTFKSWAPKFNIIFSVGMLLFLAADGTVSVQSGMSKVLELISSFASTLVLVLPYLSENVKQMFWPRGK